MRQVAAGEFASRLLYLSVYFFPQFINLSFDLFVSFYNTGIKQPAFEPSRACAGAEHTAACHCGAFVLRLFYLSVYFFLIINDSVDRSLFLNIGGQPAYEQFRTYAGA